MLNHRLLSSLSLLAVLLAGGAFAQQEEPPPAADVDAGSSEQERPAPEQPGDNKSTTAERSTSPYDYRSSEEISEDLSVSFPVDI